MKFSNYGHNSLRNESNLTKLATDVQHPMCLFVKVLMCLAQTISCWGWAQIYPRFIFQEYNKVLAVLKDQLLHTTVIIQNNWVIFITTDHNIIKQIIFSGNVALLHLFGKTSSCLGESQRLYCTMVKQCFH